jgi:hypothetical protein
MMAFDMHVRSYLQLQDLPEDHPMPKQETALEIWEVMPSSNILKKSINSCLLATLSALAFCYLIGGCAGSRGRSKTEFIEL